MALPACDAVSVQVPTVSIVAVTADALTEHTVGVVEANVMGSPEDELATSAIVAASFCWPGLAKVIVCTVGVTIVIAIAVVAVTAPEVPVTVTVTGPASAAVLEAVSVRTCVPVTLPAAKVPVTPAGRPVTASVTAPVKPP